MKYFFSLLFSIKWKTDSQTKRVTCFKKSRRWQVSLWKKDVFNKQNSAFLLKGYDFHCHYKGYHVQPQLTPYLTDPCWYLWCMVQFVGGLSVFWDGVCVEGGWFSPKESDSVISISTSCGLWVITLFFQHRLLKGRFPRLCVLLPESCSVLMLLWETLGYRPQRGSSGFQCEKVPQLPSGASSWTAGPWYPPSQAWHLPVPVQPSGDFSPAIFLPNHEGFEMIIITTIITIIALLLLMRLARASNQEGVWLQGTGNPAQTAIAKMRVA